MTHVVPVSDGVERETAEEKSYTGESVKRGVCVTKHWKITGIPAIIPHSRKSRSYSWSDNFRKTFRRKTSMRDRKQWITEYGEGSFAKTA